jgi:hypothetical protein
MAARWKLGGFAHSGTHALVANHDPFLAFEQDLTSPNIALPGTLSKITLSFQNQQSLSGFPVAAAFKARYSKSRQTMEPLKRKSSTAS